MERSKTKGRKGGEWGARVVIVFGAERATVEVTSVDGRLKRVVWTRTCRGQACTFDSEWTRMGAL